MSHSQYQIKQWFPCYNCSGSGSMPAGPGGPNQYAVGGVMPCGVCGGHGCDYGRYNAWRNDELAKQRRIEEQRRIDEQKKIEEQKNHENTDEYSEELARIEQEAAKEKRRREIEQISRDTARKNQQRYKKYTTPNYKAVKTLSEREQLRISRYNTINTLSRDTYKPPVAVTLDNIHSPSQPLLFYEQPVHKTTMTFKICYGIYVLLWYVAFGLKLWITEKGITTENITFGSITSSLPLILWLSIANNFLDIVLLVACPIYALSSYKRYWVLLGKVVPEVKPMLLTVYTKLMCDAGLAVYFLTKYSGLIHNLNIYLLGIYIMIIIMFNIVIHIAKADFSLVV